jgi:hypothetical protein
LLAMNAFQWLAIPVYAGYPGSAKLPSRAASQGMTTWRSS